MLSCCWPPHAPRYPHLDDAFVPFLPMCDKAHDNADPIELEMMTIAKLLIDREMKNLVHGKDLLVKSRSPLTPLKKTG